MGMNGDDTEHFPRQIVDVYPAVSNRLMERCYSRNVGV